MPRSSNFKIFFQPIFHCCPDQERLLASWLYIVLWEPIFILIWPNRFIREVVDFLTVIFHKKFDQSSSI